ncbi:ABC transporter ATP-binding protein [Xylophilus sp. GOD-11R]|uniref:ABC transporter ATP-binding protein n=1 Tax=Xylophilus sp. GOD-11R TaxID=3089814 RepID=UPI00298BFD48|nr:ABC transporter ATP-binding protein [Xylophilus sp. GOD-11R]WPB55773.1 ABC transporter ATP-binding protein [Xylophilus sp. GOD-11R]
MSATGTATPVLQASNIVRRFGGVVAVNDASLTVGEREIVGLIGPNGSGKSTMVNMVTGEQQVNAGTMRFAGQDITALPAWKRARLGMARSFQMLRLFGSLSVQENLLLAHHTRMRHSAFASFLGRKAAQAEERRVLERARELLAWFDLEAFADKPVSGMSIGQQRMVELARGLIAEPRLFVLDEPAAGLSPPNVDRLMVLIQRMRDEFGMSILLVEHDMRVVRELCDHVVVLDSGNTIARGEPEVVVADPKVIEAYIGSGWNRRAKAQ